jgi:carbonic anhydrase
MTAPRLVARAPLAWLAAALMTASACVRSATPAAPTPTQAAAADQQSPVDIRSSLVRVVGGLATLDFHYATDAALDLENTGSPSDLATVRANVGPGAGDLEVGGRAYRLVQFHWHVPSEHELNGQRFPMEMHLVHNAADGSTLVTGVLIREGNANAAFASVFGDLPARPHAHAAVAHCDIAELIPHDHHSVRYTGSMTTPPYTTGVRWIVLTTPIELSPAQIAAFHALFPEGNSREVQRLDVHALETDAVAQDTNR